MSMKLAAHRGFSEFYPENTLLAMTEALKLDIDMLEIDLHMTGDGEIILMHDHTVDRTTNGKGLIREKTLAQMLQLDAGSWKGEQFTGLKVPTFRQFLELMKDYPEIEVNVELKDYPHESGDFAYESCDKSIAMLEEYGMIDRIYINTWSGELGQYIYNKYGKRIRLHGYYPMFLNKGEFDRETYYEKMFCVCLFNRELNEDGTVTRLPNPVMKEEDYAYIASTGAEPWAFFTPTEENLKKVHDYGVVGFTVNDAKLAGEILNKLEIRKFK